MESLPPDIRDNEHMAMAGARAALELGDYAVVERVLARDMATVREGETTLTDLWFSWHERRLAAAEGVPVDDALRQRVRKAYPPPSRIDFRMG